MPKLLRNKKGRKTRGKKAKKRLGAIASTAVPVASTYLDSVLHAIFSLSPTERVAFGLSICSLFCTAIVIHRNNQSNPALKDKKTPKSSPNKSRLSLDSSGGLCGLSSDISQLPSTVKQQVNKSLNIKLIKGRVPTEDVTKIFQRALSAKRPQQALIADNFYHQILSWTASQLDFSGQSIIVNYLLWYYRTLNVHDSHLTSEQGGHIRYWADFQLKEDTQWGYYNVKFDYMYTVALLSKSIPHMRVFYKWLLSEDAHVRHPPPKNSTRKQNYYLTRFQTACILGEWSDVYRMAAHIRRLIKGKSIEQSVSNTPGNDATTSLQQRTDYFMHYTLKAMEQPAFNPNFSIMYQSLPYLEQVFGPTSMLAPPVFTTLHVYQYRYRNVDENVTQILNNSFVFTSEKFLDDDGYYKWYPMQSAVIARIPKVIKIWGRICQMVSPLTGSSGFLPMTGTWSDTKIYMQSDWTFRAMRTQLTRKQGILELERTPNEMTVNTPEMFGSGERTKTGYVWKGKLSVYTKQLKSMKNTSLSNAVIGDDDCEDVEGNGSVFKDLIMEMETDDEISLMIYEVELVIASDEAENIQREKEKERAKVRMKEMIFKAGQGRGRDDDGFGAKLGGLTKSRKEMRIRQAFASVDSKNENVNDDSGSNGFHLK